MKEGFGENSLHRTTGNFAFLRVFCFHQRAGPDKRAVNLNQKQSGGKNNEKTS